MAERGYGGYQELIGRALHTLRPAEALEPIAGHPIVDPERCNGCGICVRPGHCDAVIVTDGLAIIHAETCTGCGICVAICPRKALEWDTSPGIPTGHRE